jgi:hypothetical protein
MTRKRPLRRTSRQCMQIFLTEALTFMMKNVPLSSSCDPGSAAVRIQFKLDPVAYQHADAMQTHLSSKVRQSNLAGIELHAEQRVRKRLFDDSFHDFCGSHICVS